MRFVPRLLGSAVIIVLAVATSTNAAIAASLPGTPAAAVPAAHPEPVPVSARPTGRLRPGTAEGAHSRAQAARVAAVGSSALDLINHGGPIMPSSTTFTIFWLPPGHDTITPNYIALMNRYLADVGGSPLYNVLTQYSGSNGDTANSSTFGGTWTDTAAFPNGHDGSSHANAVTDADIRGEITRALANNPSWGPPGLTRAYFVFTGNGVITCMDATHCSDNTYCAYHSSFNGNTIYGSMPFDGPGANCYAGGPSPNNDEAADAELSSLEHEHFESVNDPRANAWFNSSGDEVADICNRVMGPRDATGANLYLNGHPYEIQEEYSNASSSCVKSFGPVSDEAVSGSLAFGTVPRGDTATRTVTVANNGNANLTVLDVSMAAGSDPAFTVLPDPGTPQTVAPGGHVDYTVRFATPLSDPTGGRTGTLRITSTDLEQGIVSVPASVNVGAAPSQTTYTGATTADFHDAFTASARLTVGGSVPVPGKTISFSLGGGSGSEACSASTDGSGTASCSLTPQRAAGATTVSASFAGDSGTQASSATVPFTVTKEETTLTYTGPTHIANGIPAHLSGVLKEDGTAPIAGRTVRFTMGAGSSQQTCQTTTDGSGTAACTIASVHQPLNDAGTVPLLASFDGDAFYRASSANATLLLQFATGRAFGLSGGVNLPLLPVTVPPTPDTGPIRTADATTTNVPCTATLNAIVATARALCANVTTTIAPGTSTATANAADVTIGVPGLPVIEVSGVTARSFSSCGSATGSATLTLTIAGAPVTIPSGPNVTIPLAVGTITVNEQKPVPGADFGLTVNAVHLVALDGAVDIVVASATSDAHNCPPPGSATGATGATGAPNRPHAAGIPAGRLSVTREV